MTHLKKLIKVMKHTMVQLNVIIITTNSIGFLNPRQ